MKRTISHKPYLTALVTVGLFTLFEILFYARVVYAQGAAPTQGSSQFDTIIKVVQLASTIFAFLVFGTGIIWYIVKGRNFEQQEKLIKQLESSNNDLRATVSGRDAEIARLKAEKLEIKEELRLEQRECEKLRKANLSLQVKDDQ